MIRDLFWHIFLEGDDGGETGGSSEPAPVPEPESQPAPAAEPAPANEPPSEPERPKYFSQIPKEKADSDAYKALYKHQKLEDMADALIASESELAKYKGKSIIIPDKTDKDAVAKFAHDLGVPDDPETYDMAEFEKLTGGQKELVSAIKKACKGMMLTDRQGKAVGNMLVTFTKSQQALLRDTIVNNVKKQAERTAATYADTYTADIDRQKAADADIARYDSFLKETGLEKAFNNGVMGGNPAVIRAISAYVAKHSGVALGKGGMAAGGKGTQSVQHESSDWKNFKAQRGQ